MTAVGGAAAAGADIAAEALRLFIGADIARGAKAYHATARTAHRNSAAAAGKICLSVVAGIDIEADAGSVVYRRGSAVGEIYNTGWRCQPGTSTGWSISCAGWRSCSSCYWWFWRVGWCTSCRT